MMTRTRTRTSYFLRLLVSLYMHWILLLLLLLLATVSVAAAAHATDAAVADDKEQQQQQQRQRHHANLHHRTLASHDMTNICYRSVTSMQRLHHRLVSFPAHFSPSNSSGEKRPGDFDVAQYLTSALTDISLPAGKTLDWVYNPDEFHPVLYVRGQSDEPFKTIDEYRKAMCSGSKCPNYINEFQANTPAGYMQLVILYLMGEQFYLFDHALQNDELIVCNSNLLSTVLQEIQEEQSWWQCDPLPANDVERAQNLDLTPTVQLDDASQNDEAVVTTVVFTKWGGFYRLTHTFSRSSGMRVTDRDNLIPYDICWMI